MAESGLRLDVPFRAPVDTKSEQPPKLICFSHLRWNFVFQRPQHLLTRAARRFPVLFIEEPVFQAGAEPRLDLKEASPGVTVAVPVLPQGCKGAEAEAAQRELLESLIAARPGEKRVFWYYTPMAMGFSAHHRPDLCIYDCMDELSAFRFAPPELLQREAALFQRADFVFTGGRSLYEAKRTRHPSVHAFPSSIDAAHFRRARNASGSEPADQAAVARPRLGYFGVIDERLDLDLVAGLADLRPEWQFVMLGPVVKIEEGSLPRRRNIHWLGRKSYDELPDYLASWDVGLMPFALNEATRFISPTKTPEFLAAGIPVVSTPITDVVRSYGEAGLVEVAADAGTFVAKAEALMHAPDPGWLARVDRHLSTMSWDLTWAGMEKLMDAKLQGAHGRPVSASPMRELARV